MIAWGYRHMWQRAVRSFAPRWCFYCNASESNNLPRWCHPNDPKAIARLEQGRIARRLEASQ